MPTNKKKILIFDDSEYALEQFDIIMDGCDVELLKFRHPRLKEVLNKIKDFKPDIIISDLVIGGSREEGYNLLKQISKTDFLKNVPIIVCSKLINESHIGLNQKEMCLELPGVYAAYGKIPNFPSADKFLNIDKKVVK